MGTLTISCGTYDGSVFALQYDFQTLNIAGPKQLKPVFVDPAAHNSAVTSVATKDSLVLSGSSDEIIQIFSLQSKTRLGALEMHVGTIRQLKFITEPQNSTYCHLFSASDDGCIAIWRCENPDGKLTKCKTPSSWECIRQIRRHKGPVHSIAIHPSNRCLFSISEDKTFRVWNLLRGRQAYAIRLKNLADGARSLSVSPTGSRLLLVWPDKFDMINLTGEIPADTDCNSSKSEVFSYGSVQFPNPTTSEPVFFSEDDDDEVTQNQAALSDPLFAYVLVGVDASLALFKFSIGGQNSSDRGKPSLTSKVVLPGKRIKFLQVVNWPSVLVANETICQGRSRLLVAVTTEADCSHIRGYIVNLNETDVLEPGKSFIPLFTYDVWNARITALSAAWSPQNSYVNLPLSEHSNDAVAENFTF
uniref:WD_REPEATS_REGION domain-containing protein n=1 Tax=Trichobilharzia regenti TaxID=157069 RepID=A0AA85JN32_TRIRE|nr:unnamed protein product [Trichobilharzia regenti]